MPSVIDENTQFIDPSTGLPAVGGSLYIGSQNQDPVANTITIYSDRGLTTTLANPQTLDASGRSTNKIWVPGKYSVQVNDSEGSQKYQELDNGELAQTGISLLDNTQGTNTITAEGSPSILTLVDKQVYIFTAANTNTGAATLKIDTTAAKVIKKNHDVDLETGDIKDGQIVSVSYNAADDWFEMQSTANAVDFQDGHLFGLVTASDADADHDIQIATGSCMDSTNTFSMSLSSVLTKRIDANWTEGDDGGGFPSGLSLSTATWYHFFLIAKTDGTVDAGWDTSLSAANLLSDASTYTYYRRIASHLTDGSSNITGYTQHKNYFQWLVPIMDFSGSPASVDGELQAITTPNGIQISADCLFFMDHNAAEQILITSPDQSDTSPGVSAFTIRTNSSSHHAMVQKATLTDTSRQVRYHSTSTSPNLRIITNGWWDDRGAL